jgi:hypothetical protein
MAIFGQDTFTESSDTALESHTPEVGGSWSSHDVTDFDVRASDDVVFVSTESGGVYFALNDGTPGSADYDVECDIYYPSGENWNASNTTGVLGRFDDTARSGYQLRKYQNSVQLYELTTNSYTLLDSHSVASDDPGSDTAFNLKLELRTASQKGYLQGSGTADLVGTDSTHTSAGYSGIVIRGVNGNYYIDNFVATDTGEAGGGHPFFKRFGGTPGATYTGRRNW